MNSAQLSRLLSEHAGIINRLASRLTQFGEGHIDTDEALAKAKEEEKRVSDILNRES